MVRGKLIVIEGGEGSGKTTHCKLLYEFLSKRNINCHLGREPGGVESAEDMRKILKNTKYNISPIGELFGFCFARSEFYNEIVIPQLNSGINVILDRSGWSTEAYQGYAGNVSREHITTLSNLATRGINPNIGVIIDVDPITGLEKESEKDRFSEKGLDYHNKVRNGYLEIAKRENCFLIDYIPNGLESMQDQIRSYVLDKLNSKSL